MLSFFSTNQLEWIKFPNGMTLPHQDYSKDKREDLDERHCAVTPRKAHILDPLVNIKGYREAEANSKHIQDNCCLLNIAREALREVIDRDRRDA